LPDESNLENHKKKYVIYGAGIAMLVLALAALAPAIKTHLQALAVLKQASGEHVPWIVGEAASHPVTITETKIITPSGTLHARLYTPVDRPNAPGLVLLHGVHYLGMDEPRLMVFAQALASCGLRVLTPELPGIKEYRVDEASIRAIGESAQWFTQQTGKPVGVMGLSFSGGLALVAAGRPQYAPSIKFVFAVGSQDSMARVAKYYRTGKEIRPDGTTQVLPAHEYGPLVLEYEHLEDFVPAADVAAIRTVLQSHLYEDPRAEASAMAQLTPQQKTEALDLMNPHSERTLLLLEQSANKHAAEMQGLSPQNKLKTLSIPVFLLHGEADNIIPSAETLWMASELRPDVLQAVLLSPVLSHLDVNGKGPGAMDEWRLVHFLAGVVRMAEK